MGEGESSCETSGFSGSFCIRSMSSAPLRLVSTASGRGSAITVCGGSDARALGAPGRRPSSAVLGSCEVVRTSRRPSGWMQTAASALGGGGRMASGARCMRRTMLASPPWPAHLLMLRARRTSDVPKSSCSPAAIALATMRVALPSKKQPVANSFEQCEPQTKSGCWPFHDSTPHVCKSDW
jgi:hypothetical protein